MLVAKISKFRKKKLQKGPAWLIGGHAPPKPPRPPAREVQVWGQAQIGVGLAAACIINEVKAVKPGGLRRDQQAAGNDRVGVRGGARYHEYLGIAQYRCVSIDVDSGWPFSCGTIHRAINAAGGATISDLDDLQRGSFRQLYGQVVDEDAYRREKAAPVGKERRDRGIGIAGKPSRVAARTTRLPNAPSRTTPAARLCRSGRLS